MSLPRLIQKYGNIFTIDFVQKILDTNDSEEIYDLLKYSLKMKNDGISYYILDHILKNNDEGLVRYLIGKSLIPQTLTSNLYNFIINNNYEGMIYRLDFKYFDIDQGNGMLLTWACETENKKLVEFLINKEANIYMNIYPPNEGIISDQTPLKIASMKGNIEIVKILLKTLHNR
jgi:ankyrin repeat protein